MGGEDTYFFNFMLGVAFKAVEREREKKVGRSSFSGAHRVRVRRRRGKKEGRHWISYVKDWSNRN